MTVDRRALVKLIALTDQRLAHERTRLRALPEDSQDYERLVAHILDLETVRLDAESTLRNGDAECM